MENLFGETLERELGQGGHMMGDGLCQCGCGAVIEWKGYGRIPKYLNNAHGERVRRRTRKARSLVIRQDISRQTVANLLAYVRRLQLPEYDNHIAALEYLVSSPVPVEDTLIALADALSWVP